MYLTIEELEIQLQTIERHLTMLLTKALEEQLLQERALDTERVVMYRLTTVEDLPVSLQEKQRLQEVLTEQVTLQAQENLQLRHKDLLLQEVQVLDLRAQEVLLLDLTREAALAQEVLRQELPLEHLQVDHHLQAGQVLEPHLLDLLAEAEEEDKTLAVNRFFQ